MSSAFGHVLCAVVPSADRDRGHQRMSDASSMGNREDTVQDRGQPFRQRASVSGMRILLVVNGTDFGGTEINVSRIAVTLRKRGHHVCVLSLKRLGPVGRQIAQ